MRLILRFIKNMFPFLLYLGYGLVISESLKGMFERPKNLQEKHCNAEDIPKNLVGLFLTFDLARQK